VEPTVPGGLGVSVVGNPVVGARGVTVVRPVVGDPVVGGVILEDPAKQVRKGRGCQEMPHGSHESMSQPT
jgi:hypothetical protein